MSLKAFMVEKPKEDTNSEEYKRTMEELSASFSNVFVPLQNDRKLSPEEKEAFDYAMKSDAAKLMEHYDPKVDEHLATLKSQVKAIKEIANSAENNAKNSNQTAESASKIAKIASEKAKQADIKGWFAVGISLIGLFIEIICNWNTISTFFQAFFT